MTAILIRRSINGFIHYRITATEVYQPQGNVFYNQKAQQDNKPMRALETVQQQLNLITEMEK
jgi:uncharacterized protein YbaP (TraB family)